MAGVEQGFQFRVKLFFLGMGFILCWILRPWIAVQSYNRAQTYYSVQEFKKAELHYKRAIIIYPGFILPYLKLGYLYEDLNQYEKAVEVYKNALARQPRNAVVCYRIGFYYAYVKKDYLSAIFWLKRATELNPKDPQSRIWLEICCQRLGIDPASLLP
ncbi:MAG: tetratricopeptide repeat protein [Candidatus Omnitrophica bacterium]|nr:tetratricopeptide repeat protein [Candidatus Omnitrophota bacterium]